MLCVASVAFDSNALCFSRHLIRLLLCRSPRVAVSDTRVVDVTHKPGSIEPIQNIASLHLASNFFDNISSRVAVPLQ